MTAEPQEDVVDAEVLDRPRTRKEQARQLLLQAAVLGELGKADEKARKAARGEYEPTDADTASYEGVPLGRVRMDHGRVSCSVRDQQAALAWVEVNAPHQVEELTVPTVTDEGMAWLRANRPEWITEVVAHRQVHPAYLEALKARLKKAKGRWVTGTPPEPEPWTDPETGEERTGVPPFLTYSQGEPILNVSPSEEAAGVAQRLLAGRLPELEA